MSEYLTDALVELATVALVNSRRKLHGLSAIDRMPWAHTSDMERRHVTAALETVLPDIIRQAKAEALREAADEFWARLPDGTGNGRAYNSWRVADMLRDRADHIEAGR